VSTLLTLLHTPVIVTGDTRFTLFIYLFIRFSQKQLKYDEKNIRAHSIMTLIFFFSPFV